MSETDHDGLNRTPEGGSWTWRNRVVCWLIGHDRADQPSSTSERSGTSVWLCKRCNDFAKWRDASGAWFDSWEEYCKANGRKLNELSAMHSTLELLNGPSAPRHDTE
jgi:hypothetical protein